MKALNNKLERKTDKVINIFVFSSYFNQLRSRRSKKVNIDYRNNSFTEL